MKQNLNIYIYLNDINEVIIDSSNRWNYNEDGVGWK